MLGETMPAERAHALGMVNKLAPADRLEAVTAEVAAKMAAMPPFGMTVARQVFNAAEDIQGKRAAMDMAYGYHHMMHAHNSLTSPTNLGGISGREMANMNKKDQT